MAKEWELTDDELAAAWLGWPESKASEFNDEEDELERTRDAANSACAKLVRWLDKQRDVKIEAVYGVLIPHNVWQELCRGLGIDKS